MTGATGTAGDWDAFMAETVPYAASYRSAALEYAARERGLGVERLDQHKALIRLPGGLVPFVGLNGPDTSHVGRWLSQRKDRLRALLQRNELPVPASASFGPAQEARAFRYAESLSWQVRVSASGRSGGWPNSRTASTEQEFEQAWARATRQVPKAVERRVIIEEFVAGEVFEFFLADDRVVSVTSRPCVRLDGDGASSIGDLLERKRAQRAAHPYLCDYPLAERNLSARDAGDGVKRSFSDVLAEGESVTLHPAGTSLNAGREIVTHDGPIDPGFTDLARSALGTMPGMAYGGVAVIAQDVAPGTFAAGGHVVSGVDYAPAPLAQAPTYGEPADIAGAVVDHYLTAPRWEQVRNTPHVMQDA